MAMSLVPALSLRALTKRYDSGLVALDGFDLDIPAGEFFGLLGPNGAGKTTLISAVCNLIRVTSGEIRIFGQPHRDPEARRMMGLAEQDVNLDRFLDVEETLVYHGGYYGMSRPEASRRAREMMDVFDLRAKAGVRAPMLSGGMRRRLLLARDRFGKKPLYLARAQGALWFASEMRALFAAGVPRRARRDVLDHSLAHGWPQGSVSWWRGSPARLCGTLPRPASSGRSA